MSIPILERPVNWGDMDAFQHVNNTVYLRWCESARIAFFEATGLLQYHDNYGIGPILASIQCRFRAPVTYPDTVRIETKILNMRAQDFELTHFVYSKNKQIKVAEVQERCVIFDYANQNKADFPETVKAAFEDLML